MVCRTPKSLTVLAVFAMVALSLAGLRAVAADKSSSPPAVGDVAKDFRLPLAGTGDVSLHEQTAKGKVVVVVLRGWPGSHCPACSKQVIDLASKADEIKAAGASVLLIYPGPAADLKKHAAEFPANKDLPSGFTLALDPDYAFTKAWGLRWDAPNETAYPSTFVVDGKNVVRFVKISKTHTGRATAAEVLAALK